MQAAALPWGCSHAEPWGTILPEAFTGLCPVQDNVLHPLPASRLHPQNLSKPWLCMHEPQQHILPASPPQPWGLPPSSQHRHGLRSHINFQPGALKSPAGPVVFVCGVAYRPAASCLSLAVRPRCQGPAGCQRG